MDQNFENTQSENKKENISIEEDSKTLEQPSEQPIETSPTEQVAEISKENVPTETDGELPSQNYSNVQSKDDIDVESYVQEIIPLPQERQIEKLLSIIAEKGIDKAAAVAKRLDDPFVQDSFHDIIMNNPDFKAQLEDAGKIEKM